MRLGRFFVTAQITLMLGVVAWLGWRPVIDLTKGILARRAAAAVRAAVMNGEMSQAAVALGDAWRWNPDEAAVIEASILYFQAANSNPAMLLRQFLLLETKQPLSLEQQCLMGQAYVNLGKTDEARMVLSKLSVPKSAAAVELEAAILKAEGMIHENDGELAWQEDAHAPKVRLKNALNGLANSFPELVRKSRDELWSLVELNDPVAMQAAAGLATDYNLTLAEARRLMKIVEDHPQRTLKDRLHVVSALLRLQPESRKTILDDEVASFERGGRQEQIEFARWLAKEKEHDRLVRLLPRRIISQSPEYYAVVADSLVNEDRWEQLGEMLENMPPPVPRQLALLWQAEVQSHLQPDLHESRRLLEASIGAAKEKEDVVTLFKAAEFARKSGIADLATVAYKATAVFSDRQPVELLQKAYDMALQQKCTADLLAISRQLHELRPASVVFSSRLHYYNLLLGLDLETTALEIERMRLAQTQAVQSAANGIIPLALLQSIAAYRVGNMADVGIYASTLKNIQSLPPGERTVAAGLLALSGKTSDAYRIAEKVHPASLLYEELTFYRRSR